MDIKMSTFVVTLVCLVALTSELVWSASQSAGESHSSSWLQFKRQYGKVYPTREEEAARFAIYLRNRQRVEQHNANKSHTYTLGINHMSDWKEEEFARMSRPNRRLTGKNPTGDKTCFTDLGFKLDNKADLPDEFDWRTVSGRVSSVKDQRYCGAGWAFATIGLMEGQQKVLNSSRSLVDLSAQQLVDCSGFFGCNDGSIDGALDYIDQWGGIQSEADYKYTGWCGMCLMNKEEFVMPAIDYCNYYMGDEELIKQVLFKTGPIAVSLDGDYFRSYKEGVFELEHCSWEKADHSLLIVGYGVDTRQGPYWTVKNSWGTSWGELGYMRIKRGVNMCGIVSFVVIPKI